LVTLPFAYVRPLEKVVVATHVGVLPTRASTCPAVPVEVVARRSVPLPYISAPDCILDQPVPPYTVERVEEALTRPLTAWRGPVRDPTVRVLAVSPLLKVFAPEKVLVSERSVEDANVHVEVE
jgi:hypothetical protein